MKKLLTISALALTLLATSCSSTEVETPDIELPDIELPDISKFTINEKNKDYLRFKIRENNKAENLQINFIDEKVYKNVYIWKEERQTDIYYYLIQTFEPDDIAPFHDEFECYLTYNEDTELRNLYEVNDHFNR